MGGDEGGTMARTKAAPRSVSDYIAAQPRAVQPILRRVRSSIRKALPAAEETISYQIPTYRIDGRYVVYFAGWAKHYSLYPVTDGVRSVLAQDLEPYAVSKGTVRFPLSEPVPAKLIERIATLLARESARRAAVSKKGR
jgi:uncharacterized protein YdhG (YjbR/CyaY superfamily)